MRKQLEVPTITSRHKSSPSLGQPLERRQGPAVHGRCGREQLFPRSPASLLDITTTSPFSAHPSLNHRRIAEEAVSSPHSASQCSGPLSGRARARPAPSPPAAEFLRYVLLDTSPPAQQLSTSTARRHVCRPDASMAAAIARDAHGTEHQWLGWRCTATSGWSEDAAAPAPSWLQGLAR